MALPYYGLSLYSIYKAKKENSNSDKTPDLPEYEAIIPARNEKSHIQKAILSLLNQTHPPKRIHIVDDASNDGTLDVILSTLSTLQETTCNDIKEERLKNQKFIVQKCHNSRLNIEFWIWINKGEPLGKGASVNELASKYVIQASPRLVYSTQLTPLWSNMLPMFSKT